MRTIFVCSIVLILLVGTSSCRKSNPVATLPSGTWAFLDSTFHTVSCMADSNTLIASNGTSSSSQYSYSILTVGFSNTLPTTSGTYAVANCISGNFHLQANEAYIILNVPHAYGLPFLSAGTGTVTVSVSGGKVSIAGSNITMAFYDLPSDSSRLSFNITQSQ